MTTFLWIIVGVLFCIAALLAALALVHNQDRWDDDNDRWDK